MSTGGAWTTVGSSGKTSAAVVASSSAGARPAVTPTVSSKAATPVSAPTAGAAPVPTRSTSGGSIAQRAAIGTPTAKVAAKVEEAPAPSLDFMKWLGDALKGLNSSVNRK